MTVNEILERIAELNPKALSADGLDEAVIGIVERCGMEPVLCYDARKCVEILMERDGMTRDEAQEFFEFNTLGAYMGEGTPMYLTVSLEEEE